MVRMIKGSTLVSGKTYSSKSGAFTAPDDVEKRLVHLGVAEFVSETVATFPDETDFVEHEEETNDNKEDLQADSESVRSVPLYDVSSNMNYLRKIAKEHGITVRVGITKADLISELDAAFGILRTEDIEGPVI